MWKNICEARVTCTHHGVTQDNGGLAEFVLGDPAVQQDGLQQAAVVQVNVIVPFLQSHKRIFQAPSASATASPDVRVRRPLVLFDSYTLHKRRRDKNDKKRDLRGMKRRPGLNGFVERVHRLVTRAALRCQPAQEVDCAGRQEVDRVADNRFNV